MIHILTPCSRPNNLEEISKTIPKECLWHVIYDDNIKNFPTISNANFIKCESTGKVGADGRNYFVNNYPIQDNDWLYSLDDDNIIHPDFFDSVKEFLDQDYSIIHWGQLNKNFSIRLLPKIGLNEIDAACFITKWKFNKHIKYVTDRYDYDGIYALDCSQTGPILKIEKFISFYNYLR